MNKYIENAEKLKWKYNKNLKKRRLERKNVEKIDQISSVRNRTRDRSQTGQMLYRLS